MIVTKISRESFAQLIAEMVNEFQLLLCTANDDDDCKHGFINNCEEEETFY